MIENIAPVLEVAVYSAATEFDPAQQKAHEDLASFPGFVSSLALRGHEDSASRCDLVLWESLAAAKAAAEAIQKDPRFAGFMGAIEKLRHFAHYDSASAEALLQLGQAPVVEVAAYQAKEPMRELQANIHRALDEVDGAYPAVPGAHPENELSMLDLIGWDDKAAHSAAPAVLQSKHPELAAFFTSVAEMTVFELFQVVE